MSGTYLFFLSIYFYKGHLGSLFIDMSIIKSYEPFKKLIYCIVINHLKIVVFYMIIIRLNIKILRKHYKTFYR